MRLLHGEAITWVAALNSGYMEEKAHGDLNLRA